jgi:hypothetical protein
MDRPSPDRDLRELRASYIGAVRQLDRALRRYDSANVQLDPGASEEPPEWTSEEAEIIAALPGALTRVIDARRQRGAG